MSALHRRISLAALAVAAGAASVALLASSTPAFAIANGEPVVEGQYRFATKLTMTNIPRPDGTFYNSACSASLIAPQWIITAGHCFHDVNRNPVSGPVPYATTATIGRTDLTTDTNGYVIDVVADYQSPINDVAVAKLATPVYDIAPVALGGRAPQIGQVLRITGWGALDSSATAPATHLQTGQVKISTIDSTTLGVVGYLPEPTTSACPWDSGAPYFADPVRGPVRLLSVESTGPDCPHDQVETTARVDTQIGWIYSIMQNN